MVTHDEYKGNVMWCVARAILTVPDGPLHVRKIGNAHIFEPLVARDVTRRRLVDEILSFLGGKAQPMMAQLSEAGKLARDDILELERIIKERDEQEPEKGRRSK